MSCLLEANFCISISNPSCIQSVSFGIPVSSISCMFNVISYLNFKLTFIIEGEGGEQFFNTIQEVSSFWHKIGDI